MRRWIIILNMVVSLALLAGPVLADEPVVHVVQRGENLYRISLRYGVSMEAIMAANGLDDPGRLLAGQELVIPVPDTGDSEPAAPTTVQPGDVYTVQAGDTLGSIAARHGITVWALAQANELTAASLVYTGQTLLIPGQDDAKTAGVEPGEGEADDVPADTYVVRRGDTLMSIARRYGTTAGNLASLNRLVNPSIIYVGQVLRLSEAAPAVEAPATGGKRIEINLSQQHLYAYQGEQLVFSFVASSGAAPSYTRAGEFLVQSKIPSAYGASWDIWMPYWLGIYWAGSTENGIHALPILPSGQTLWAGYLGTPISYGCIVLGTAEAEQLYYWAEIGTPVSIHY